MIARAVRKSVGH